MASKKIQGITIKLGVDETALGKALKSIRNESKGISGELTQVNRLLKFDPGNTEVLAQKQTLLAKGIIRIFSCMTYVLGVFSARLFIHHFYNAVMIRLIMILQE